MGDKKKIDAVEARAIVGKAAKLIPDIVACIDGVSVEEAEKLVVDAMAVADEVRRALQD